MWKNPSHQEIADLLRRSRNIAVVGLSAKPARPSHSVARYLMGRGYRITGIHPAHREILGVPCHPRLGDIPADRRPDIVNIFRRSEEAGAHILESAELGIPAVWTQLGVVDEAASQAAASRGVLVIMDRCIAVDHRRLL